MVNTSVFGLDNTINSTSQSYKCKNKNIGFPLFYNPHRRILGESASLAVR